MSILNLVMCVVCLTKRTVCTTLSRCLERVEYHIVPSCVLLTFQIPVRTATPPNIIQSIVHLLNIHYRMKAASLKKKTFPKKKHTQFILNLYFDYLFYFLSQLLIRRGRSFKVHFDSCSRSCSVEHNCLVSARMLYWWCYVLVISGK